MPTISQIPQIYDKQKKQNKNKSNFIAINFINLLIRTI